MRFAKVCGLFYRRCVLSVKLCVYLYTMLRAYKYALFPTFDQKETLAKIFGSVRFVYNLGLETKMQAWVTRRVNLNCIDLANQMKELKDTDAEWLNDCPSQALQMSLRNLDNAYTSFFRGGGFPKFKSKHNKQSFQLPQGVKVDYEKGKVFLPKLKWVDCILHRTFTGEIKTVTVSKTTTGKYFVSILVDNQKELPKKKPVVEQTAVGVDLGIKILATFSGDEPPVENPQWVRKSKRNLRVQQRSLNRKEKGTKRYEKQRLVVARLHERLKNQRDDYLHKVTTTILSKYDTVIVEDLNIKGMIKNHNLALAISEIGWHKFNTMLDYKADWQGKNLIRIGRFEPSSKLCSTCGKLNKELKLSDRHWTCQGCSTTHDRDRNAAENIKTFGLRNKPSIANVSQ